MTTTTLPSAEVQQKARTLLEMRAEWATVRNKQTGWRRIVVPSLGDEVGVRYVDPSGRCCSCDAGRRGILCYHRLAVTTEANRRTLNRPAATIWRRCAGKDCEAIIDPISPYRFCDDCAERRLRILEGDD
jgi:hypothetical protein